MQSFSSGLRPIWGQKGPRLGAGLPYCFCLYFAQCSGLMSASALEASLLKQNAALICLLADNIGVFEFDQQNKSALHREVFVEVFLGDGIGNGGSKIISPLRNRSYKELAAHSSEAVIAKSEELISRDIYRPTLAEMVKCQFQ